MRIIDKNYDYYDYLKDQTDPLVFDRRGSFLLTRERVCESIRYTDYSRKFHHLLLQCGSTFWLFLLTVTSYKEQEYQCWSTFKEPNAYDLELIATWKNYDKPRHLIELDLVDFPAPYIKNSYKERTSTLDRNRIDEKYIYDIFNKYTRQVRYEYPLGHYTTSRDYWSNKEDIKYDFPLLYACGIADLVDAVDIFCAIEEGLSLEKTALERTEPLGATNDDKIVMHGFDTKTSFRGKQ